MPDKLKNVGNKIKQSPLLFFILAGLYPVVFLVGKNWFVYETKQLLFLLIIPLISGFIGIIILFIFWIINKISFKKIIDKFKNFFTKFFKIKDRKIKTKRKKIKSTKYSKIKIIINIIIKFFDKRYLIKLFICLTGFSILTFLLIETLTKSIFVIAGYIIFIIFMCFVLKKSGFGFVNTILILATMIALGEMVYSMSTKSLEDDKLIENLDKKLDSKIKFKKTPNIYLIHLEAYQSPVAMEHLYNIDNSDFIKKLNNLGFFVSQNNFSNYNSTIVSIASIFLQQHHFYKISSGMDDAIGVRDMVGGRMYNPVLSILKNNGYKIIFLQRDSYAFMGSEYLDYYYPANMIHDSLLIFQNMIINKIRIKLFNISEEKVNRKQVIVDDPEAFYEVMIDKMKTEKSETQPNFFYIKYEGVHHSPSNKVYSWKDSDGEWSSTYKKYVNRANPKLIEMLEAIIKNDQQAMIILYGDHGAWKYRNIWVGEDKKKDVNDLIYERKQISAKDLALDIFGVFSALRYPDGNSELLEGETHVNLFRKIFSDLAQNNLLLEDKPDNDAYIRIFSKLYIFVKDGEAVDRAVLKDGENK